MKKKQTSSPSISLDVISYQLKEIHTELCKNTRDIESLKTQVAMGKGGIKAVFVIGTFIGIIVAVLKILKLYDWIISKIIT
jgi:hypothetical protein